MPKQEEWKKNVGENLDNVREHLLSYENKIKEYLEDLEADIEGYKFSVEKHDNGLTIEIGLKATIHPKK